MRYANFVVNYDLRFRKLLARYIKEQGFRVQLASRCAEVRERIATNQIDLIVLDVIGCPMDPGSSFRHLRSKRSTIPMILLTALKEERT